jgi:hypothetical protein
MSRDSNGGVERPLFSHVRFNELEVCWAGPHPFRAGFCFGTEDGRLLFTDELGNDCYGGPTKGSISGEAINGVASWRQWLMVTTRREANLVTLLPMSAENKTLAAIFPAGAHGVITTVSGYFVCPLGPSGLMVVKPQLGVEQFVTVLGGPEGSPYVYRVISLGAPGGKEILACATRKDGVSVVQFGEQERKHNLNTITFDGLDVVDVCTLNPGADSLAVAAVDRDGTLILFRDVLQDNKPVTMKFDTVEGTAYRLLSCRGHLYLLTSKGLYVLGKLAERFVGGESIEAATTPVLPLPMEAVDANLYKDQWLLVVLTDEVRRYDIGLIHESTPEFISHGEMLELQPRASSPSWRRKDVTQNSRQVLAGVA